MTYFVASEEWQRQSAQLLRACPTTTRITTKYHVPSATADQASSATTATTTQPTPKAYLELKTYDPSTGACLKYKTDKAAEVGRLIASLGTLGRDMAALPEVAQDVVMSDVQASGQETPLPEQVNTESKPAAGKKKKKGKK